MYEEVCEEMRKNKRLRQKWKRDWEESYSLIRVHGEYCTCPKCLLKNTGLEEELKKVYAFLVELGLDKNFNEFLDEFVKRFLSARADESCEIIF